MLNSLHPLVAQNALFADIGKIFHPVFILFGWILAGIYSVIPNYAVAIAGLTVLIMAALTPVTVKSTRSMIAMQRLQPEMKKLQAKYKGAENRVKLNEEMMKLYKENGTSPFGACLPTFLQIPFLIVLYSLIRGLSHVTKVPKSLQFPNGVSPSPLYLNSHTKIFNDLKASFDGKAIHMHSHIFGMDLSQTPLNHHGANQTLLVIPYFVLVGLSVFLQYFQMKQMNSRNPQAAAANPQMQTMQKVFPLLFGVFYLNIPAGAAIYMLVSSVMRIGTQEVMFRTGMVTAVVHEREIGPASKAKEAEAEPPEKPAPAPKRAKPSVTDGSAVSGAIAPPKKPTQGGGAGNGARPGANKRSGRANGSGTAATNEDEATAAAKAHPRSRSKRARKAR
jgi:YidC/Oxa1 family membrane protein insertase